MNLLEIKNLKVSTQDKTILNGVDLVIKPGEVHVLMGPNGSGKSTLSNVLCAKPGYDILEGSIYYKGEDLNSLSIDKRAAKGIFLAFQHPIEIPGVNSFNFLKQSINAIRKTKNQKLLDIIEFNQILNEAKKRLGLEDSLLKRELNVGFSGGEKKKFDILHMTLLNPDLIILDEIDSGVDVDALKLLSSEILKMMDRNKSFLIITHYQKLLSYIKPNFVHIMKDGKIIKSGDINLAEKLDKEGFAFFKN